MSQFDDDIVTVCDGKQITIGDKIANGKECTFECAISDEVMVGKATGTCTNGKCRESKDIIIGEWPQWFQSCSIEST